MSDIDTANEKSKFYGYSAMHFLFFIIFSLTSIKMLCMERVKLDKFSYVNIICFKLGFLSKIICFYNNLQPRL